MTAALPRAAVRVAVQSSRRLLRDTLATCLATRPDVTVVGKVADPAELPALCELARPDTVIFDAGLRLSEFAVFAENLLRHFPGLNVVMIYRDASEADLTAACRGGVTAIVPESHGLAGVLALLQRRSAPRATIGQGSLTDRELELVMLTSSGHSVAEIAVLLRISPLTVENLKRRVYAKLDVHSSVQAVSRAASLGMLDQSPSKPPRRPTPRSSNFPVLTIVSGQACPALDQVVVALVSSGQPFVLVRRRGLMTDSHWAAWNRGPVVAALVNPEPADWDLIKELGIPAIVVHSKPLDGPELARALAGGANSLVPADRIRDHFLSVLRMVSHGYLVVDSQPMRALMGVVRGGSGQRMTDGAELPELTARESDILQSVARGYSIRQTARGLGISPKTVENIQTRLFRKLGAHNRAEAFAVADALGLLPETPKRLQPDPLTDSSPQAVSAPLREATPRPAPSLNWGWSHPGVPGEPGYRPASRASARWSGKLSRSTARAGER
jgi:two-component system, NarL family, nitrate/nitrite response regulator NarL